MGTPQTHINLPSFLLNPTFMTTEPQKVPRHKEDSSVPAAQVGSLGRQATNIWAECHSTSRRDTWEVTYISENLLCLDIFG